MPRRGCIYIFFSFLFFWGFLLGKTGVSPGKTLIIPGYSDGWEHFNKALRLLYSEEPKLFNDTDLALPALGHHLESALYSGRGEIVDSVQGLPNCDFGEQISPAKVYHHLPDLTDRDACIAGDAVLEVLIIDHVISVLPIDPAKQIEIYREPVSAEAVHERPDPAVIRENRCIQGKVVEAFSARSRHDDLSLLDCKIMIPVELTGRRSRQCPSGSRRALQDYRTL